jgi:hypothetical protein
MVRGIPEVFYVCWICYNNLPPHLRRNLENTTRPLFRLGLIYITALQVGEYAYHPPASRHNVMRIRQVVNFPNERKDGQAGTNCGEFS